MSGIFITGIGSIIASGVVATLLMLSNAGVHTEGETPCIFAPYGIGAGPCTGVIGQKASPPAADGQRVALIAEARTPMARRN